MGKDDMVTNFNGDQRNHIQMYLTSVENTSKPTMFSPSSHSIESDILLFVTFISANSHISFHDDAQQDNKFGQTQST